RERADFQTNPLQHRFHLPQYLMVPETQHPIPPRDQIFIPLAIPAGLLHMLPTIQFDHQEMLQANEVDDVAADGLLSLELESHEALGTRAVPRRRSYGLAATWRFPSAPWELPCS